MEKGKSKRVIFGALTMLLFALQARAQVATTTLQQQLDAKQAQLAAVNAQLQAAKANFTTTHAQTVTLQNEVAAIEHNIKTLNLGIQADNINAQKLQLQTEQLSNDQQDITASIALKQNAILDLMKTIQKSDSKAGDPFGNLGGLQLPRGLARQIKGGFREQTGDG